MNILDQPDYCFYKSAISFLKSIFSMLQTMRSRKYAYPLDDQFTEK